MNNNNKSQQAARCYLVCCSMKCAYAEPCLERKSSKSHDCMLFAQELLFAFPCLLTFNSELRCIYIQSVCRKAFHFYVFRGTSIGFSCNMRTRELLFTNSSFFDQCIVADALNVPVAPHLREESQ